MNEMMKKKKCDRCHTDFIQGKPRTLSMMNMDVICMSCKNEEQKHPMFKEASMKEHDEVINGNTNYEGLFAGQSYPFGYVV